MKRTCIRFLILLAAGVVLGACSVEVSFDQNIDIGLDAVSGSGTLNKLAMVSERAILDGLEESGYALTDFDDLVLRSASVFAPYHNGWDGITSLRISFSNDHRQFDVFPEQDLSSGGPDVRPLILVAEELLGLYRGKSFFVGVAGSFVDTPGILLRIRLTGYLIRNIP